MELSAHSTFFEGPACNLITFTCVFIGPHYTGCCRHLLYYYDWVGGNTITTDLVPWILAFAAVWELPPFLFSLQSSYLLILFYFIQGRNFLFISQEIHNVVLWTYDFLSVAKVENFFDAMEDDTASNGIFPSLILMSSTIMKYHNSWYLFAWEETT